MWKAALGWRIFAHLTAGAFLFIVGVSLVLSTRRGLDWKRFLRRLGVIAAAARRSPSSPGSSSPTATSSSASCITLPSRACSGFSSCACRSPVGDRSGDRQLLRAAASRRRRSSTGRRFFGSASAHTFPAPTTTCRSSPGSEWCSPASPRRGSGLLYGPRDLPLLNVRFPATLLWAGRHSLLIYLLHQPILFGARLSARRSIRPTISPSRTSTCETASPRASNPRSRTDVCRKTCACAGGALAGGRSVGRAHAAEPRRRSGAAILRDRRRLPGGGRSELRDLQVTQPRK